MKQPIDLKADHPALQVVARIYAMHRYCASNPIKGIPVTSLSKGYLGRHVTSEGDEDVRGLIP